MSRYVSLRLPIGARLIVKKLLCGPDSMRSRPSREPSWKVLTMQYQSSARRTIARKGDGRSRVTTLRRCGPPGIRSAREPSLAVTVDVRMVLPDLSFGVPHFLG